MQLKVEPHYVSLSIVLRIFILLCNYQRSLKNFNIANGSPVPTQHYSLHFWLLLTIIQLSICINLPVPGVSHKWNHMDFMLCVWLLHTAWWRITFDPEINPSSHPTRRNGVAESNCVYASSLLCLATLDIISIQSQGGNEMREVWVTCQGHPNGGRARTSVHRSPLSGSRVFQAFSWTLECWENLRSPRPLQELCNQTGKTILTISIYINTGSCMLLQFSSMDVDRKRS